MSLWPTTRSAAQAGVGRAQRPDQLRQHRILPLRIRHRIGPLELDADREIIAGFAAAIARATRVPGAIVERHVLRAAAVAAHEPVGRDPQVRDFGKSGMRRGRQIAAE